MFVKSTSFMNNVTLILLQLAYHVHNQSTQEPVSSVGYVLACGESGPGSYPARVEYFPVVILDPSLYQSPIVLIGLNYR